MKIKVTISGSPLDVGTVLDVVEIPTWLVNKCIVIDDCHLEVATPNPIDEQPQKRPYKRRAEAE